jgi:iron complex outermembrane receptor protein
VYANAGQVLPAALSRQDELGIRTEALPGTTASIALFSLDRAAAAVNASNYYVLDGRTRYQGVEFAANGDLSRQLSLMLSGLLLDTKLKAQTNALWNGKTPDNTAKTTYSLFAEYRPDAVPGFSVNGGAYYVGKRPLDNLDINYVPAYTVLAAGVRYRTTLAGKPTSFQVNVDNLADKRYWSAANSGYIAEGTPRTISFFAKVDL